MIKNLVKMLTMVAEFPTTYMRDCSQNENQQSQQNISIFSSQAMRAILYNIR